jgi:hypothetical protein
MILVYQKPKNKKVYIVNNMATKAKGFVTDRKLKAWKIYEKNNSHARDSLRHAIFTQIFHNDASST